MIRGNEDIPEALLNAFRLEKGAQAFYLSAAERISDENGASMFRRLAGMEEKHMHEIYSLYNGFQGDRSPVSLQQFKEEISAEFMESGGKIEAALSDVSGRFFLDSREVLRLALKEEEAARKLYLRLAERSEDSGTASLYRNLAEDEMAHMEMIREALERKGG
ncbi:MAG: ferritin family protein [Deltaproteobacteria bacterium]|nr:ferritin family protein [Deltaproteobacteria bacterium]